MGDVRNSSEYAGDAEPGMRTYGHISGAIWMPQLTWCGTSVAGTKCSQAEQVAADVLALAPKSFTGEPPLTELLKGCSALRIAFVCHSGVRSLVAADRYAKMLRAVFEDAPETVVSIA